MQCPSCRFENMPGMQKCVRCGGVLGAALVDINVNPPRAGQRWTRHLDGFSRVWNRLTGKTLQQVSVIRADIDVPVPLITLIWPGWPQFAANRRLLGYVFCSVFVLSLIPALLTWGSGLSTLLLGLALACHFSSVMDIVLHTEEGRQNVGQMFGLLAVVVGVIYLPAYWFGQTIAQPVVIQRSLGAHLPAGDVLLINSRSLRTTPAQPGDIVLYDQDGSAIPGYVIRGDWIERVLARGPCRVEYAKQQMKIDGQVTKQQPMAGQLPDGLDLQIPADHVLLAPPNFFWRPNQLAQQQQLYFQNNFTRAAVVSDRRILGRAVWRTSPLNRWGPIE